jgi:LysM repeat protein
MVMLILCRVTDSLAQYKLEIEGTAPKFFLTHKVAPKETWFALSRMYNLPPAEIATYNKLSLDKPLQIAQKILVPLTSVNFSQDGNKLADEVFVPLHHKVADKEWMFRISTTYNKVDIAALEKWNKIKNEQLQQGMLVIVGYLKVNKGLSPLAAGGLASLPQSTGENTARQQEVPVAIVKKDSSPAKTNNVPAVEPNASKAEAIKPFTPAPDPKPVEPLPTVNTPSFKGGVFRKFFQETGNDLSGNAGIFRSGSGWNDGKYYALINNIPAGTIIRVSFSSTGKSIYAKVLGQLPEMKESQGLSLRISDAAAAELGVANTRFFVDVHF